MYLRNLRTEIDNKFAEFIRNQQDYLRKTIRSSRVKYQLIGQ